MTDLDDSQTILVTGATGYIGGRLVPRLLERGHRVRCLVRSAKKLASRTWANHPDLSVVEGDAANKAILAAAMDDCHTAYYLIHSMMTAGARYRNHDRALAQTFAQSAEEAGVARIIYLGGLGETGAGLSEHLSSRQEVENALSSSSVPVTNFRAAMIIGSGSASFEILRYLVERLPVMITPRWVATECQPIAVRNTLHYLVACLDVPETIGATLDIGGPEVMPYRDILQAMARSLGLKRRIILPVPVLTPRLSSLWIHLVTPVSQHLARPLAEGLRNRVVCRNDDAARLMPQQLLSVAGAIDAAVGKYTRHEIESTWTDAGVIPGDPAWAGGAQYHDERSTTVAASPAAVFTAACRVGGKQGWYSASWLWKLRGMVDRLAGGPGLGRGRRHPDRLEYGDALDFWRVTVVKPQHRLELRAEMKLPGDASLEFEVSPGQNEAVTVLRQTAHFAPRGLAGLLYWFSIKPAHGFVFGRMIAGIKHDAETAPPLTESA